MTSRKSLFTRIGKIAVLAAIFLALYLFHAFANAVFTSHSFRHQLFLWFHGAVSLGGEKIVMQKTNQDCGPASLKMIFDRLGIASNLEEITFATMSGGKSSFFSLKKYAEYKGLIVDGLILRIEELESQDGPLILLVNNNHFVVLEKVYEKSLIVLDPSMGRLVYQKDVFARHWKGPALRFKYSIKPDDHHPTCSPKGNLSKMLSYSQLREPCSTDRHGQHTDGMYIPCQ